MEFKQIQELIKAINKSNISELSIEEGEFKITIKQAQTVSETQFVAIQAPSPAMQQVLPQAAAPVAIPAAAPAAPSQPAAASDNSNLITI